MKECNELKTQFEKLEELFRKFELDEEHKTALIELVKNEVCKIYQHAKTATRVMLELEDDDTVVLVDIDKKYVLTIDVDSVHIVTDENDFLIDLTTKDELKDELEALFIELIRIITDEARKHASTIERL